MREASVSRKTKETDIQVKMNLDGGKICVSTGIGFFDHMLTAFATHAGFGLEVSVKGDLEVDCHHTVEDTGIVIGQALNIALGDKVGIERFGNARVPMDEALADAILDISGRPYLVFFADMPQEVIGEYDSCITLEFMRALSTNAGLTLHIISEYGENAHHITEAIYKAVGRSLKVATRITGDKIPSTKGAL
ncbi:MAG: imidazoleglycerol-phosphate dehydratase HisB [Clostridia bacterium]|nr:imidazoleglycerol-phosphate dehydratase HisB [Clostridia bacterium]